MLHQNVKGINKMTYLKIFFQHDLDPKQNSRTDDERLH